MNVLVFALQTVPDIDGARRLYDLHGLSDDDVARAVLHKRRQAFCSEIFPVHLQKIVTISAVWSNAERFKVWSLGDVQTSEQDLLQRFYDGIERFTPRLVSWGGTEFEKPVLHYRSLLYSVNATRYWEMGDKEPQFKENNYLQRSHQRHTDLREVLAADSDPTEAGLNAIAKLCGFPGSLHADTHSVSTSSTGVDIKMLNQLGECRVLNIYLLYLNWERNRGNLTPLQYTERCKTIRSALIQSESSHLIEFEKNWIDY